MRRLIFIAIMAGILIGGCATEKVEEPVGFEGTFGVWAGRDCELVRTGLYSLLFWRDGSRVSASLTAHEINGDSIYLDMRGMAIMDSVDFIYATEFKDLVLGGEIAGAVDDSDLIVLSERTCFFEDITDKYVISSDLEIIEEFIPEKNRLKVQLPDGTWRTMKRIESIVPVEPYLMRQAKRGNIGDCLQEWSLGVDVVQRHDGHITGITIGTNRHAYVFLIGGMIYCRAARIRSIDIGSVFSQNIRMMNNYTEFTAVMDENNLTGAGVDIEIDPTLFDPKVCVYADDGIYWSLKSFTDRLITLNGCGGADYTYQSVAIDAEDRLEWFEFVSYEKAGEKERGNSR